MITILKNKDKKIIKVFLLSRKTYQLGKREVSQTFLDSLNKALIKHEAVKISIDKSQKDRLEEIILSVTSSLAANLVDLIGFTFSIYRYSPSSTKHLLHE